MKSCLIVFSAVQKSVQQAFHFVVDTGLLNKKDEFKESGKPNTLFKLHRGVQ